MAFYNHVGDPPTTKHTIDRIDSNGNYEPSNVRWATPREQSENKRNSLFFEYRGATKSLKSWAADCDVSYMTLFMRIKRGASIDEAIEHNKGQRSC